MNQGHKIQNFDSLATSPTRRQALEIAEAGLEAIDTEKIVAKSVRLEGNKLFIKNPARPTDRTQNREQIFDLEKFNSIKVVGFGKASSAAAIALEKVLGNRISGGVVIGIEKVMSQYIESYSGTHPRPSPKNVEVSEKIFKLSEAADEKDLVIVIVSGGGSALLCYPAEECTQGEKLYNHSLRGGSTINETNIVRKHLSLLKGGGLAKALYPATVIGLIFSDVPGGHDEQVSSGPTFKDSTTIEDAQAIIDKYNLGQFDLVETPKEDKYFEKVQNFVLVSNQTALDAMAGKAHELGLTAKIVSSDMYDPPAVAVQKLLAESHPGQVTLAGGEPTLIVKNSGGTGGRCSYTGLEALGPISDAPDSKTTRDLVAVFLASDGIDNDTNAGVIVDSDSLARSQRAGLDPEDFKHRYDSRTFFEKIGDLIMTGPTGANVSDLMILVEEKPDGKSLGKS